jgi:thiamine kinase-like enzyme
MSDRTNEFVGLPVNKIWDVARAKAEFGTDTPPIPQKAADLTPALLNQIIKPMRPDVKIKEVDIVDAKVFGTDVGLVSTANRVKLRAKYTADTTTVNELPTDIVLKLARTDIQLGPLYGNETRFYQRLSREVGIEVPFCLGAVFNPETQLFAMLLGDLSAAGARFPNVMDETSEAHIYGLVEILAKLHARYWESPRFKTDLAWLETHVTGTLADFMNYNSPIACSYGLKDDKFKRELLEELGTTEDELNKGTRAVQVHQSKLPQTICHGDAHYGNTYIHADGRVGLCDWQLSVRGHCMHDVNYTIVTALSIGQRRKMERQLLEYYIDRLCAFGVKNPPSFDEIWAEYRRGVIWSPWIGWIETPVSNYGWEINVVNHLRLAAAYQDLETGKAVAEVM